MHRIVTAAVALVVAFLVDPASALEAGWRPFTVARTGDAPEIVVALYYPTKAPSRAVAMGPFLPQVAIQGPPEPTVKALIVLSHGTGGSELAHSSLAEALARDGYLVAALRHPGDNWQDRSLIADRSGAYFVERPRQATRVIDAVLADPEWRARIASDAAGPRVGALGHSAGGYTVLALAGASPDPARLGEHCRTAAADDPVFCELGTRARRAGGAAPPVPAAIPSLADRRVRAVVALAPLGVVFTASSLEAVRTPVALYEGERDRFLVPRFHGDWVAAHLPGVEMHRVANAGHFAFLDVPTTAVGSDDGDIAADPPGFDRPAFLRQLAREIPAFFDRAFR